MNELFKIILYSNVGNDVNNWAVLTFRVLLAIELFRVHGLKKFRSSNGATEVVPNPLHLPPILNDMIATFSDTFVPVFVILGLLTRIAVLPTIGVTATGYFVVHRNDPVTVRDVPYIYTLCFSLLLITGAGDYSIDHYLFNNLFTNY